MQELTNNRPNDGFIETKQEPRLVLLRSQHIVNSAGTPVWCRPTAQTRS